jgi:hypothetical protein
MVCTDITTTDIHQVMGMVNLIYLGFRRMADWNHGFLSTMHGT